MLSNSNFLPTKYSDEPKKEIGHRRRYNYLLPDKESENEEYIYRNKVILKKPISPVWPTWVPPQSSIE